MKKILFIGGGGFIGSNLVQHFCTDKKYAVYVFEPIFANLSRLDVCKKQITIFRGILSDEDLLASIIIDHNIDIVVHLVSTLVPGSDYSDYQREFENVIFPTTNLMSLCAIHNVKFVYFSSGGTIYGNNSNAKFCEDDKPAPISYYGLSKQILEDSIFFENRRDNLKYLIIRPSNPYGKGQNLNGIQGFIAVAVGKILSGESIDIWGDGSSVRDYISIDNLSKCFHDLINNDVANEVINIGSGIGYSNNDIITILKGCAGRTFEVKYSKKRLIDVNSMVLDISKLKHYTNESFVPLPEGISEFYQYAKKLLKQ